MSSQAFCLLFIAHDLVKILSDAVPVAGSTLFPPGTLLAFCNGTHRVVHYFHWSSESYAFALCCTVVTLRRVKRSG